ncbi:hypothetical protein MPSEU_000612500 [Mayamaea pseudoterrestris]|nr:hypothetical protein MPSEU_000612500 [Mayamaea pseudoterrestris]
MSDEDSEDRDNSHLDEENWKNDDFLSFKVDSAIDHDDSSEPSTGGPDDFPTSATNMTTLPPWMDYTHPQNCHRLVALHNEIVQFVHLMEPTAEEKVQRESLIERVRTLVVNAFNGTASVNVFGSQATGLFLPSSDIDLVVSFSEQKDEKSVAEVNDDADNALPVQSPLHILADAIRREWLSELSYLEVIEQTRVPLVKFTHASTNISVDICFSQENGVLAASLMTTMLQSLPPLRPLTICLKYFLASRELHQPYTGGIGSYMLQLMIVSLLQHRARDAANFRRPCIECLGSLLLEFFALYGQDFNFVTTGISVRHDGFYFPKGVQSKKEVFWQPQRPFSCAIENPLETTMDVGQTSFRIQLIQRAFGVAYKTLLAYVAEPSVPTHSILATIIHPTQEMRLRKQNKRQGQQLATKRDADVLEEKGKTRDDRRDKKKKKRKKNR